jgi:radical SAM superfamily enzyme YgiQ (UPF0313 family)
MKIGLIALSGIRVCDDELLRLGLTLPGFVERSKIIASLPSLGLLTLAGQTPPDCDLEYIEVADVAGLKELPNGFDLVGISSYSAQINEAYELASRYRAEGVASVLGGPHVTSLPDEAAEYCSSLVIGEGEACWPDLVRDFREGRLRERYDSKSADFDLADSPMPDFGLLDINKYNRLTVQTSRGCPHRCDYCAGSNLLTSHYKQKPLARVLAEIDQILEIWKHPFLEFADDNSVVNRGYWKELTSQLIPRKVRWFTETDVSVSEDSELLSLMRRSGCAQVLIGFESPIEQGLVGVELNSDWKHRKFPYYKEAIETIQSHGISVNGCFVIGLDGHTADIFDQVFEFVRDSGLHEVQVTILTPFPGTQLYDRLSQEGRLLEPKNWRKCTLFDVNYVPKQMSLEQLATGFRSLVSRLYSDDFTKLRRSNFKELLRRFHLQEDHP